MFRLLQSHLQGFIVVKIAYIKTSFTLVHFQARFFTFPLLGMHRHYLSGFKKFLNMFKKTIQFFLKQSCIQLVYVNSDCEKMHGDYRINFFVFERRKNVK
jgi:hypothetical protein